MAKAETTLMELGPCGYHEWSNRVPAYWPKLYKRWKAMIHKYCLATDYEDLPYHHIERSNVGFVAAAAWGVGKIALEEYHTTRVARRKTKSGRADLWISGGHDSDIFEAKILEFAAHGNLTHAKSLLGAASRQVRGVREPYEDPYKRRFALLFCTLSVRVCPGDDLLPPALDCIAALERIACDAIFWTIPPGLRGKHPHPGSRLRWEHPGAAVLIRQI